MQRRSFMGWVIAAVGMLGVGGIPRTPMFKAYMVNDDECYGAETPEQAVQIAMGMSGCSRDEYYSSDEIYELGSKTPIDMENGRPLTTVGEELAAMVEPGFLCGTDW